MSCGLIIWDYNTGDVICADTGEIIDRIYDYSPARRREEEPITIPYREARKHRRFIIKYIRDLRKYNEAKKFEEQGFIVDFDKYLNGEPYSILTRRTIEALKEIEANEQIRRIIEIGKKIVEENPYLTMYMQRTIRVRLALQYIIGSKALGLEIDRKTIMNTFKISNTTYLRLIRIANQIQPYIHGSRL